MHPMIAGVSNSVHTGRDRRHCTESVLAWTTSFVASRTQQVLYKGCLSAVQPVQYGVPQGSVLGPILFVLHTADVGRIVAQHRLKFHQYADDFQIYIATSVNEVHSASISFHAVFMTSTSGWVQADYAWTPARYKCCSSASGITSTDSLFMGYQSCRLLSASSAQHATSALSLIAGCQWPTTWRQSVAQHTVTCGRLCTWRCKGISPRVHLQSPELLQLSFVRHHRQNASATERCRQVNHTDGSPWTHLTCYAGIALDACLTLVYTTRDYSITFLFHDRRATANTGLRLARYTGHASMELVMGRYFTPER